LKKVKKKEYGTNFVFVFKEHFNNFKASLRKKKYKNITQALSPLFEGM